MRTNIFRALNEWAQHTKLVFSEVWIPQDADIKISLQQKHHNDKYIFDGKGGTLAHAFYPTDGRVHLDLDDISSTSDFNEQELFSILLHEFGHSLGLAHSTDTRSNTVMHPFLRELHGLGQDDIEGIQALFGRSIEQTTQEPTTTTQEHTTTTQETTKHRRKRRRNRRNRRRKTKVTIYQNIFIILGERYNLNNTLIK
jgi:hypothetical protein